MDAFMRLSGCPGDPIESCFQKSLVKTLLVEKKEACRNLELIQMIQMTADRKWKASN